MLEAQLEKLAGTLAPISFPPEMPEITRHLPLTLPPGTRDWEQRCLWPQPLCEERPLAWMSDGSQEGGGSSAQADVCILRPARYLLLRETTPLL